MFRAAWFALCAGVLVLVVGLVGACGGGGGGGGDTSLAAAEVRTVMSSLLQAAAKDDFAAAQGKLAVQEFTGLNRETPPKPLAQLTPEEREDAARSCFNQLKAASTASTLSDPASIEAALAAGSIKVLGQIRKAEVKFQGPPVGRNANPVHFKSQLRQYSDDTWRLISFEVDFLR